MRSDPVGFAEVSAPLTAEGEAQALVARTLRRIGLIVHPNFAGCGSARLLRSTFRRFRKNREIEPEQSISARLMAILLPSAICHLPSNRPVIALRTGPVVADLSATDLSRFYRTHQGWRSGASGLERQVQVGAAASELRVVQRDLKLMESSPHSWCVDRCLATGHCDAAEDMLQLTTTEVIAFCEACGAEECERPDCADGGEL